MRETDGSKAGDPGGDCRLQRHRQAAQAVANAHLRALLLELAHRSCQLPLPALLLRLLLAERTALATLQWHTPPTTLQRTRHAVVTQAPIVKALGAALRLGPRVALPHPTITAVFIAAQLPGFA